MAKRALIAIVAAIVVLVTVQLDVGTASVGQTGGNDVTCQPAPPPPMPPASDFGSRVDNKYFPLEPGTTLVYRGYEGRHRSLDIVTVLHRTKTILGIMATVVADRVILDGHRSEKTLDWYAQDVDGKYFVKERTERAVKETSFWQDYKFVNPVDKKIEPKQMYCERLEQTAVCSGIYRP